jgi:hypothetical protein
VKSAYKVRNQLEPVHQDCWVKAKIWKSKIHDKLKLFLWRIASNLIPTLHSLSRFNSKIDCLYDLEPETPLHNFWECPLARALWFGSKWRVHTDLIPLNTPYMFD